MAGNKKATSITKPIGVCIYRMKYVYFDGELMESLQIIKKAAAIL